MLHVLMHVTTCEQTAVGKGTRLLAYLVFRSVPVVDYASRDEEAVVHVAAAAVVPAAVIAHLGLPVGKAYGSLASCSSKHKGL